ncbi:MAG: hypothetical protein HWN66_21625, partial [Candidatus Helarchaeota archaeon]|nr:hypothetical protein [Candidatus Helarchaeota archaeon]
KLVLTETIDEEGNYRFSFGTSEEWDDETKKLEDFIPGEPLLNHQGTRIWIIGIKPEFKDELLDYRTFMKYISATWWEIIRNYKVTFIVNFDGVDRKVELPDLPKPLKERSFNNLRIRGIGEIRNLILRYCEKDVSEEFRGVAIQRGGMTVLRLPVYVETPIKSRIYGYCNFDSDLEMELKKCEMPNHFGFFNRKTWNHVREHVKRKIDDFLLEITPKREKIMIETRTIEEAVKLINDLVSDYAPELLTGPPIEGVRSRKKTKVLVPPREAQQIRIDIFRPNQRKFEYNETLVINCEIANDTNDKKDLFFKLTLRHFEGTYKHKSRYELCIPKHSRKKIDIQLIDFDDKKDQAGEYIAEGILEDRNEQLHKRKFAFYLDAEPPKRGKAFVKEFSGCYGKERDGTLRYFAKWKNLPINEKRVLLVVWDHPEFVRLRENTRSKKAEIREIILYFTRCGIDEALKKLLELKYGDNTLDLDKIQKIKNLCDEMLYEASLRIV